MIDITKAEILRFRLLAEKIMEKHGGEKLAEDAFLLGAGKALGDKKYPYVVSAIIHGNEVGGISSVNDFLELYLSGSLTNDVPTVVFLGNVRAAEMDMRFVERDMNRSFNMDDLVTHEARRAKDLESIMLGAGFYLDIHQTKKKSSTGFFIFPFKKESFEFARSMLPRTPIVTHWGTPFSSEGMCSDEFVNKRGGTGLTLELGQNGFDPYNVALGLKGILAGYNYVRKKLYGESDPQVIGSRVALKGDVYTWEQVVPYPEHGEVFLDSGWDNFKSVKEGKRMGTVDGKELYAPCDGFMIFPNYTKIAPKDLSRPKELYRLMKKIPESELPEKVTY
jgi:succinylglutamate desuccinylase